MIPFCPHCGQFVIGENQQGKSFACPHCGRHIDAAQVPEKVMVDATEELLRRGSAARCPLCRQVVEVRFAGLVRSFVPHRAGPQQQRICPNSGKTVTTESPPEPQGPKNPPDKDLSAFRTRAFIKVIFCPREAGPRIEELTLEYLDKKDRVRLQIEALREILGPDFCVKAYPAQLNKPYLGVWGNGRACVVARKHDQAGYQPMSEADIKGALEDIAGNRTLFFQ